MISKVVFLCAALAAVHANVVLNTALVNTGVSTSSRNQDVHGNYAFGYDIVDKLGASNSRAEVGDGYGNKKGTYTIYDIDGRARRVDYVADKLGFRAAIKTNEPGTAHSTPAAVLMNSPYAGPSMDHIAPVATAVVGHAVAAPVVAAAPIAYGGVVGHGAALGLGYGNGVGLAYGNGVGLAYGNGVGLGYGKGLGLGYGNGLGLGYGAGIGKGLVY